MISRVLAADVPAHIGARIRVAGWVHRRRELKSVTFLVIRDRSGLVQIVLPESDVPEETVVEVEGVVIASGQAPGGAEITEPVVTPLTEPAQAPPFDLYRPNLNATLPTILDNAPVALRHPEGACRVHDHCGERRWLPCRA
ncbi:OB-fold nucleic acid binding domain-containing protein [Kibdelosporangium aridum]|uniref:OB-fold nucleic acid binding domain-containing protein n=1 Tax=Kibdelosporangium aridum TaxID=2030 RepID=UPI0035EBAA20